MRKIVFYGVRYSGRSSTMQAMGKVVNKEVIDELWEKEDARIKKIIDSSSSLEIITCPSPYKEEEAIKKLFKDATEVYYFIPFPNNDDFGKDEFLRQINLFPEMVKKAEDLQKGLRDISWTIVFSKCDRLTRNPYLNQLPKEFLENYISVSAKTGAGLETLWGKIKSAD